MLFCIAAALVHIKANADEGMNPTDLCVAGERLWCQ
jgi:hypothetical protein